MPAAHKTTKDRILEETLTLAAFEGWSDQALEQAAENAGEKRNMAYVCFPGGVRDAIAYYGERTDREMERTLEQKNLDNMKIRERIMTAVLVRLEIYGRHKEAVRRLVARYALPHNAPRALGNIWRTVDLMWYAAGDTSTDYNYYTKRALLAGVYTSTVLCWIRDDSKECNDTKSFLARRIEDVMKIEKAKGKLKDMAAQLFPAGAKF